MENKAREREDEVREAGDTRQEHEDHTGDLFSFYKEQWDFFPSKGVIRFVPFKIHFGSRVEDRLEDS